MKLVSLVDLLFQPLVGLSILKIASDVIDSLGDPVPELQVDRCWSVLGNLLTEHLAEALRGVVVGCKTNDRELRRKQVVLREIAERRDKLALGEVAGRTENNHHTGCRFRVHVKMVQGHERGFLSSGPDGSLNL